MRKFILFIALSTAYCSVFAQTYKTVKIGDQVWMAENLNVDTFRNGDIIPHAQSDTEWKAAGDQRQPAWCYYAHNTKAGTYFGKLYNWYAVMDSRGLAPDGWHVPSDGEWTIMTNFLGGLEIAGIKMKSDGGWDADQNGTNESGFGGLPAGYCDYLNYFNGFQKSSGWWSTTQGDYNSYAWVRLLNNSTSGINRTYFKKEYGMYVRCIKN